MRYGLILFFFASQLVCMERHDRQDRQMSSFRGSDATSVTISETTVADSPRVSPSRNHALNDVLERQCVQKRSSKDHDNPAENSKCSCCCLVSSATGVVLFLAGISVLAATHS